MLRKLFFYGEEVKKHFTFPLRDVERDKERQREIYIETDRDREGLRETERQTEKKTLAQRQRHTEEKDWKIPIEDSHMKTSFYRSNGTKVVLVCSLLEMWRVS